MAALQHAAAPTEFSRSVRYSFCPATASMQRWLEANRHPSPLDCLSTRPSVMFVVACGGDDDF